MPLLGLPCSLANAPICNSQVIIVVNCYMHCASGNKKLSVVSCQLRLIRVNFSTASSQDTGKKKVLVFGSSGKPAIVLNTDPQFSVHSFILRACILVATDVSNCLVYHLLLHII